jgi:3-hydroxyacyl-CoA dehydrogenase
MMSRFNVKKVAVLGAGVMGAQIAAHLVNVKVPVVLFDLPAKEGPKNGIVSRAIEASRKLKPARWVCRRRRADPAGQLRRAPGAAAGCDLIIEAIAERMDWKLDLYRKIAPFCGAACDRGLQHLGPVHHEAQRGTAGSDQAAFCGIHFFNPPRYMALVELINTPTTQPQVLDDLEAFVTSGLGKGVVRAKDSPNFIANRIGIAGMLATMKRWKTSA